MENENIVLKTEPGENVVLKIQPNYREYLSKAIYAIIPLVIALAGVLIGVLSVRNCNEDEMLISYAILLISISLSVDFLTRVIASFMKANKAKNTSINVSDERIYGVNANYSIDIEMSNILSVSTEEALVEIGYDGVPKSFKVNWYRKLFGLSSKYLNIRTNDGKNIYIDCIDSLESTKNTIQSIITKKASDKGENV